MVKDTLSELSLKLYSDVRTHVEYATKVFANHVKYEQVIEACDRSLTKQALEKLRPIALLYNCTFAQLALDWLIVQPQTNA